MPYYPNFQPQYSSQEEQMLFAQFKMQMQINQFSQQQQQPNQQSNQATSSQPQSDHQPFNLLDETEDENEEDSIPTPTLKKTSRGPRLKAKAKKNKDTESQVEVKKRARNLWTDEEELLLAEEHFGDDVLPRPPELLRLAKSQRSGSNSIASSGSNPIAYQEFMAEQYKLDRKAKM
uniref:Uncharacterized protein n=1 Tax=Tanacetum cinerariifolium TaxID=118510 RepID=A0A6L2KT57_TANCI|nr:hypothetical protein [Tanacetum cinerariifolium]